MSCGWGMIWSEWLLKVKILRTLLCYAKCKTIYFLSFEKLPGMSFKGENKKKNGFNHLALKTVSSLLQSTASEARLCSEPAELHTPVGHGHRFGPGEGQNGSDWYPVIDKKS